MNIYYSKKFAKEYKNLPREIKLLAEKQELIFRKNPHDIRLKTHKLKGQLKEFYSFSVAYAWRIIFHFENKNDVIFDNIGTHQVYK